MADMPRLPDILIEPMVAAALREDLGRAGDVTSCAVLPEDARLRAEIRTRSDGRIAGMDAARLAFSLLDSAIEFSALVSDGDAAPCGAALATIEGPARAILSAERTALNFLGHLSGVATATAAMVQAISGARARICCTRKTTPGLRALEKHAVRCGGGSNHRFGLDDAVLIKDNHIAAAGGVTAALERARASVGHLVKIEIEIDALDQLDEALSVGVDAVLLDNMDTDRLKQAVTRCARKTITEASGNVTLETVGAIAATGVDYISSGALTHSARNLDIGLDIAQ
ncbi:MAG: carboxylating nicotinate-nucleotide diphosphorylase [Parvularculaceae bacterium]